MDGPSAQGFLSLTALRAEGCGIALGHTFGVKVLKMDRPAAGGFLGLTAFQAEGCGLPLCGNAYKISVTDLPFCVIGLIGILLIGSLRSPPPKGGDLLRPQGSCMVLAAKGGIKNGAESAVPRQRSDTI